MVLQRMPLCIRCFRLVGRRSSGWISSSEIAGSKVKCQCVLSVSAQGGVGLLLSAPWDDRSGLHSLNQQDVLVYLKLSANLKDVRNGVSMFFFF